MGAALLPQARSRIGHHDPVPGLLVVPARRPRDGRRLPVLLARRRRAREPIVDATRSRSSGRTRGAGARAGFLTAWTTRDTAGEYKSHAFLPLFYEASAPDHFALLTPLAGYRKSGASKLWYALLPPILSTDSVQTSFSMVFPLWFRHTDKALEQTTTVFPPGLYMSRRNPEESFTTALALFWRFEDVGSATQLVLPLFYDVHDYHLSRTTVLFPFFLRHQNDAEQSHHLGLAVHLQPHDAHLRHHVRPAAGHPAALLGHQARQRRDDAGAAAVRALEAPRLSVDAGDPVLLPPGRPARGRHHRRHLPPVRRGRGAGLRLGREAPGRLQLEHPGRPGRPRARRPPPVRAPLLVLQLRDGSRSARADRLVQRPAARATQGRRARA